MNTYILLFRGINVGGHNILPMKALAAMLENCGYADVKTYIQSGNVVLKSTDKPTAEISELIETEYGFKPQLMVLSISQFKAAINNNPFSSDQGKTIHFFFLTGKPSPDIEKMDGLVAPSEAYYIKDQVFYLHAPDGIGRSKLAAKVEACLGVAGTGRNLNTIHKLLKMIEPQ
ncbi:MAG: DUF1697 domain-containing protein [Marinicella sp.]